MQLFLAIAALAAAVSAVPAARLVERDPRVFTVTEVVNVWTTVTVYGAAPTGEAEQASQVQQKQQGQGFRWRSGNRKSSTVQASPTPEPASPSVQPQPVVSAPVESPAAPASQAPAPAPTSEKAPEEPAASPPPSGNTGYTSGSYADTVVSSHNVNRAKHSAPDMAWDAALASTAQKIAETCSYGHSMDVDGGGYGQNIAAGAPLNAIGKVISEQFYGGGVGFYTSYGQKTPSDFDANFHKYGHFTQVVWVASTKIGCASVDCSNRGGLKNVASNVPGIYHVCNYKSAGNFIGQFDKNVLPPKA